MNAGDRCSAFSSRAGARQRGRGIGHQPLEQRDRPRRGGDHLPRPLAKAQPELQHVESRVGMAPLGELVGPGGAELRAAQAFRILRRKGFRHRAVRPFADAGATKSRSAARARLCAARRPETPSIITSRTSCSVSPTSAMRPTARSVYSRSPSASPRTHSAPARVLPAPRPPRMSQVRPGLAAALQLREASDGGGRTAASRWSSGQSIPPSPSRSALAVLRDTIASIFRASSRRKSLMSRGP